MQINNGFVSDKNGSQLLYTTPKTQLIGIYSGRILKDSDLEIVWKLSIIEDILKSIDDNER